MNSTPLWQPSQDLVDGTLLSGFMAKASQHCDQQIKSFDDLWQWSVEDIEGFWSLLWNHCGVIGSKGTRVLVDGDRMPGAQWFPDATLNYAENLLRDSQTEDAIVFWGEDKVKRRLTRSQLLNEVSLCQQALVAAGVKKGDRVAGLLPNMPETIIAMLATASLGAIWSSASPDFGEEGVIDRFGQIEPKVFFCVDGYYYNGKVIGCMEKNVAVANRLPSLQQTVVVSYLGKADSELGMSWSEYTAPYDVQAVGFEPMAFNDPLFIMFSSGTTGVPKCIVHSVGGTLLQHLKEHQFHADVRPSDRLFYFTTCGWMMWNWLVSGLASEATLLLYDGSPFAAGKRVLFDFAEVEGMTQFGTSAKFIEACGKFKLQPKESHDLRTLRAVFSTGSPLAPEGFDYVYKHINADVQLSSISGGTDIISCFALGSPILPVWKGELQCRGLAMAVDVFDDAGHSVAGQKGELVCTRPFPSMPIGFWKDPDGQKYHDAYFDRFENIWCHGDYVELTEHNGMIIHGRSDATLNPGGVRIGTAEIYRQVETVDSVMEAVVIGQEWRSDVRVVLFVMLREGIKLNDTLIEQIKQQIKSKTTPRHVPARVIQVADIPRTKNGKIVELAVREVVHGREVKNIESLANPEALDLFRNVPEIH